MMTKMMVAGAMVAVMAAGAYAGAGCCAMSKSCAMKPEAAAAPSTGHAGYGTIDTAGLKKLVDAKVPVVLVDARTAQWDDGSRIPGAIWVPSDSEDAAIEKALPSKDALIVAYCSNLKCPASKKLAERLVEKGYQNVIKYPEGLQAWVEAGYDVQKEQKAN